MAFPNLLYLNSHDTGRFIHPYGHRIETPHLQRLAEEGVLFRQAFSAAPTCSPNRASLLTGRYPQEAGMHGLAKPHFAYRLQDYSQTLPNYLRRLGYATVQAGVSHIGKPGVIDPAVLGYSRFLQTEGLMEATPQTVPLAVEFLRQRPSEPFFLEVGFNETHRVNGLACTRRGHPDGEIYLKHRDYDTTRVDYRYTAPPPFLPDHPEIRRDMANFAVGAQQLDHDIGAILAALAEAGLAENTLVIATADHGIEYPGAKCNLRDHGDGVFLIVRGPGGFSGGRVCEALVQHLDLFPTICALLGTAAPTWLRGHDLGPLVRGEKNAVRDALFLQQGWHERPEPLRAIRIERYKYIRRWDAHGPKPDNCDNGPAKQVMQEAGFFNRHLGHEELYDLYLDPQECANRVADPALEDVRTELCERLDDWMAAVDAPLATSGLPVPPPAYPATQFRLVEEAAAIDRFRFLPTA